MPTYGTGYGGWWLPDGLRLKPDDVVLSAGAGEDVSFDLAMQSEFGCGVVLVDPTDRAVKHWQEVQEYYGTPAATRTFAFSGSIQPDYRKWLESLRPQLDRMHFVPIGLWTKDTRLNFYKQENPHYVSQSLIPGMYGHEYTEVPVTRLSTLMQENGLKKEDVALVKLDIEGAELAVLDAMLADGILPRVLCVEFDAYLKGKDVRGNTAHMIGRLMNVGYTMARNQNWNVTFVMDEA